MNKKYQILIVEDQAMPAQLFEQLIKTNSEYNVVATVSCAAYALNYCVRSKVDLILMDVVTENGISGLDVSEKIKERKASRAYYRR